MTAPAQRHHMFFFSDGTHVFQAGKSLFKVHASILSDKSEAFNDMFKANLEAASTQQIDGHTEDMPIFVPVSVSEAAFELFLSVVYAKWRPDMSDTPIDTVVQLLELSRMYICQDARKYAIQWFSEHRTSIRPSRLLSISTEYNIFKLFTYAFGRLVKGRLDNLTDQEYTVVNPAVWAIILKAKEVIRLHRHIVACEAPPMIHVAACTNTERCALDWKQLWWNGMGRFLLDGRNPQPYKDAVERFEAMEIGEVSVECWRAMIYTVKGHAAFRHEQEFIERTAKHLAGRLLSSVDAE